MGTENFKQRTTAAVIGGFVVAFVVVLIGVIALPGGDDGADQSDAAIATAPGGGSDQAVALFTDNCGQCHALSVAGTPSGIGPDLDDEGYDVNRVLQAIEQGPGEMSAGILEGEDAQMVAELIGSDDPLLAPTPDD